MVNIKGLQKTSLNNFREKICCVVFLGGCNFKCPFCFNPGLVFNKTEDEISEEEFFKFLKKRKGLLAGVCITGGEPTLTKDLVKFAKKIKDHGFSVKIDTNGSNPNVIKKLIDKKIVDYIAMDIKGPLEKYNIICGVNVDKDAINKTIKLLKEFGEYEFRTTVVPELINKEDITKIGEWLKGSNRLYLQQFNPHITLDKKCGKIKPYSNKELYEFRDMLKKYIKEVEVRGE